jgi:hypothetical protein
MSVYFYTILPTCIAYPADPWGTVLFEKCIATELIKKFPTIYGAKEYYIQSSYEPATGPYPETDESIPYYNTISSRSIFMLSFHLCPGLPNGLFLSGFPPKIVYSFLMTLIIVTTCPTYLFLLDLLTLLIFGEEYKL